LPCLSKELTMSLRTLFSVCAIVGVCAFVLAPQPVVSAAEGPTLASGGPLTFGPDNVLFIADNAGAKIVALELGDLASGGTPGTKDVAGIDQQIAALLGTDAREIQINDLAISPTSHNAFISVSRGRGATATPVLLRVDGAGEIEVVSLSDVTYTDSELSNAPVADPGSRRDPRASSITDMAYVDGRLFIAGLSNEEFSSKLRSLDYPFTSADEGTSVEIWHAAHGQFETHSPVYTFVPYSVGGEQSLIAGYLCTPLVKFPIDQLRPGAKVMGTTIAELGNRNRPLDMVVYTKDGKDYLLMSNTSRGVMKIPTEHFGDQEGLTDPVPDGNQAGVGYETIAQMTGVEQLDLLDDEHVMVITRNEAGQANLEAMALP
jgi:hypothetical protein